MTEARAPESPGGGAAPRRGQSFVSYLWPHRRRLLVGAGLLLLTNALDKSIPWLLKNAIDSLVEGELSGVATSAVLILIVAANMWWVRTLSRVAVFNVGRDIEFELRNEFVDALHRLGPSFFGRVSTGDVMSRATNDLGQVRLLAGFGTLNVVNAVFAYGGAITLMLALSPTLTLWSLLPLPIFVLATRWFSKRVFVRSREAQSALSQLATVVQESVAGVRVVRSLAAEASVARRFDEANGDTLKKNMRLAILRGVMFPTLAALTSLGSVLVIWKGGEMILDRHLSPGEFTAFVGYLGQLAWPTMAFGFLLSVVQRGRASYHRVREVLDAPRDVVESDRAVPFPESADVSVNDLRFAYDGREVLAGVQLRVPEGSSVAVVGRTGSGKSTLAALLARLLPVDRDQVVYGGVDINDVALGDLRRHVTVSQQDPVLFSSTIAANVALGLVDTAAPEAWERVVEATEWTAIRDEIEEMPDGFQTFVGERGLQLSGGQKQRVALARAMLRQPSVLVLDDPLSAVDAETELRIMNAILHTRGEATLFLVTNRMKVAAQADRIVVLEGGRIAASGTHTELMRQGGLYADLYGRQELEQELEAL